MATITTLTESCTKAEEMQVWREFINTLPPCSYLALYFREAAPILEQAMAQDWSCEPVSAIRRAQLEQLRELSQLSARKEKAQEELATLHKQVARLRHEACGLRSQFEDVRAAARVLSRCAEDSFAKAVNVVNDSHADGQQHENRNRPWSGTENSIMVEFSRSTLSQTRFPWG